MYYGAFIQTRVVPDIRILIRGLVIFIPYFTSLEVAIPKFLP